MWPLKQDVKLLALKMEEGAQNHEMQEIWHSAGGSKETDSLEPPKDHGPANRALQPSEVNCRTSDLQNSKWTNESYFKPTFVVMYSSRKLTK